MKKTQAVVVALLSLSLAAGCAKADRAAPPPAPGATSTIATGADTRAADVKTAAGLTDGLRDQTGAATTNRALIVTAELHVKAANVAAASQRLRSEVDRVGGYVSDAQETGSGAMRHAMIEIRVPASQTRSLRGALADLGEITSDVEKVEDVTEARADLQARLQNARVEEKRISEIMQTKTAGLSDVLSAERELSRVREKIEQLEAQDRTMSRKIALATIKVHLEGPAPLVTHEPEAWQTPGKSISGAFHAGLKGTAAFAVYAAMVLAATAPVTVPIGLLLAVTLGILKRRKRAAADLEAMLAGRSAG